VNPIKGNYRMACRCDGPRIHPRPGWELILYRARMSTNRKWTLPSERSTVHCRDCYAIWRTGAAYVEKIPTRHRKENP
jgi:hypothetical protein